VQRLERVADCRALRISALRGTGMRELRTAIDVLAAGLVAETRANRPNLAADAEAQEWMTGARAKTTGAEGPEGTRAAS
jgi:phage terminase large subunit-like protein